MFFRLSLEYDGTDFAGWQVQAGGERTVQGCLQEALEAVSGGLVRVTGAGRTDAGVHAEGQVAAASLGRDFEPETLQRALNAHLPPDVVVREVASCPADFDPRRQAWGKVYRYRVWNARERSPLRARRSAFVPARLSLESMAHAAATLVGERDFACFQAAGSGITDTVRHLRRLDVTGVPGAEIAFEVEGSGFLRHMVRNLVGTLLEVGKGKRSADSMGALLASGDRRLAGPTAPARGLTLVRVLYASEPPPGGAGRRFHGWGFLFEIGVLAGPGQA